MEQEWINQCEKRCWQTLLPSPLKAKDGRLLDELRFENTSQGVHELLTHIAAHGEAGAVLESTANYWIHSFRTMRGWSDVESMATCCPTHSHCQDCNTIRICGSRGTVGVAYFDNQSSISFPQTTCFIQVYRRNKNPRRSNLHGESITYMGDR